MRTLEAFDPASRLQKLIALIERPGSPGEGAAAANAIEVLLKAHPEMRRHPAYLRHVGKEPPPPRRPATSWDRAQEDLWATMQEALRRAEEQRRQREAERIRRDEAAQAEERRRRREAAEEAQRQRAREEAEAAAEVERIHRERARRAQEELERKLRERREQLRRERERVRANAPVVPPPAQEPASEAAAKFSVDQRRALSTLAYLVFFPGPEGRGGKRCDHEIYDGCGFPGTRLRAPSNPLYNTPGKERERVFRSLMNAGFVIVDPAFSYNEEMGVETKYYRATMRGLQYLIGHGFKCVQIDDGYEWPDSKRVWVTTYYQAVLRVPDGYAKGSSNVWRVVRVKPWPIRPQ